MSRPNTVVMKRSVPVSRPDEDPLALTGDLFDFSEQTETVTVEPDFLFQSDDARQIKTEPDDIFAGSNLIRLL